MGNAIEMIGKKFGKLTVLNRHSFAGRRRRPTWMCVCECGNTHIIMGEAIRSGHTKSCGCIGTNIKHGGARAVVSPEYKTWISIRRRCRATSGRDFKNYVSRGISVCSRWESFVLFLEDMGQRPSGMSIDRIDNDEGYCKENCRWASPRTQAANRRNTRMINHNGITQCMSDWARVFGIKKEILWYRLHNGWALQEALETPVERRIKSKLANSISAV